LQEQVAGRDAIAEWARVTYGWLGRSVREATPLGRCGEDVLAALVVCVQGVVEARDHTCAVLKRRMLGHLVDALAVNPELAVVVEAIEIFAAGVR
jgi:hypothetical protein